MKMSFVSPLRVSMALILLLVFAYCVHAERPAQAPPVQVASVRPQQAPPTITVLSSSREKGTCPCGDGCLCLKGGGCDCEKNGQFTSANIPKKSAEDSWCVIQRTFRVGQPVWIVQAFCLEGEDCVKFVGKGAKDRAQTYADSQNAVGYESKTPQAPTVAAKPSTGVKHQIKVFDTEGKLIRVDEVTDAEYKEMVGSFTTVRSTPTGPAYGGLIPGPTPAYQYVPQPQQYSQPAYYQPQSYTPQMSYGGGGGFSRGFSSGGGGSCSGGRCR